MIININKKNYMLADDVIKSCPIWCKSIRNGRELIRKKSIEEKNYVFARLENSAWIETEGKSIKQDKVLIRKLFLDKCEQYLNEINGENVTDEEGIEQAPLMIILKKSEKFKDDEGNVLEIETRGTRNRNDIYFKVKDVAKVFGIKSLYDTLIDDRGSYKSDIDYKYFIADKKELFLTYGGMIRVLFVSRNNKTDKFVDWATDKLFTVHLGTQKQKTNLASKLLGVSTDVVKEVFKVSANTVPCVYLFSINTVKELRDSMSIDDQYDDNMLVCKYGYTSDLIKRTRQHERTYGSIEGADLKLKYYSYVDPAHTSKAESDVRELFNLLNMSFKYETYEELVIIDSKTLNTIEKHYKRITDAYGGHIKDLIAQNEKLITEKEMITLKANAEIALMKKDLMLKDKDLEIMSKDLENERLKREIAEIKLSTKKR